MFGRRKSTVARPPGSGSPQDPCAYVVDGKEGIKIAVYAGCSPRRQALRLSARDHVAAPGRCRRSPAARRVAGRESGRASSG